MTHAHEACKEATAGLVVAVAAFFAAFFFAAIGLLTPFVGDFLE